MKSKTITLIEIGGSHDECLLSQMNAIKASQRTVLLITSREIFERNPHFQEYTDAPFFVNASGKKNERRKTVSKIWKKIKSSNCDKVVLNTAEGNLIRLLCIKALFNKIEFIGIVHDTRKFKNSFTQRIINKKIKKYLMLSEHLVKSIVPKNGLTLDYFYPIRYAVQPHPIETPRKKTIVIIGGVENRRKDLAGFIHMALQVRQKNIQFIFLGKSNLELKEVAEFQSKLKEHQLDETVTTYSEFVPQETFDTIVQNADLILPLVHPNTESAEEYFVRRMSGAMCVSFGYKIPLLLHEAYKGIKEMQTAGCYYTIGSFDADVSNAFEIASEKSNQMKECQFYNAEFQENKYLSFLDS
jgi:hypothetical protein